MSNSLEDIFRKTYSPLCNFAAAMIKDKHAAEDVVQSVFIQLWENEKLTSLKNPDTYIYKCVKFRCIDFLRNKKRSREVLTADLPEMGREESSLLQEEEILPLLHYFADQLPPKMKQVFLMSRRQGMSYKEIAQHLNVSPKTIENQMGGALKKLRMLLREHQYLPFLILFLC